MDFLDDLKRFVGEDEQAAEEAFCRIEPQLRRFVGNIAKRIVATSDDVEDVVGTVLKTLLGRRRKIVITSEGAWWVYVGSAARTKSLDQIKAARPAEMPLSERDLEAIQAVCDRGDTLEPYLQAADELWLEAQPRMSRIERRRRLLAAQLFLLEGRPWREVVQLVRPFSPLSREELDEWLGNRGTRLDLAFRELYRSNEDLCRFLLAPEGDGQPVDLATVARLRQGQSMPDGTIPWTPDEAWVILLRYRNGLSIDKIVNITPDLSKEFVNDVVNRCAAYLPFANSTQQLMAVYARTGSEQAILGSSGLWRRLVFQYFSLDNLPQINILERVAPAADPVPVAMNTGILTSWLSGGRMFRQLEKFMRKGGYDE